MAQGSTSSQEKSPQKNTLSESVEALIQKKKTESTQEGQSAVRQSAENVQSEVADVMAGMEKPKESLSKANEKKADGDLKTGQSATSDDDDSAGIRQGLMAKPLPSETVMVKKIRTAIELQIKMEWKKAQRLRKNLVTGGAQEYSASISRIRHLTQVLSSLFTATFDYIKELYFKYFTPGGKRKSVDDI